MNKIKYMFKSFFIYILKIIFSNINFFRLFTGNRFIFLFHDISEPEDIYNSEFYSITSKNFLKQLDLIKNNFNIIPLDELVASKKLFKNKNYASITFDDGFLSVIKKANPILQKYKLPYTIFVNGSAMNKNQSWITNLVLKKEDKDYIKKILKSLNIHNIIDKKNLLLEILRKGDFNKKFIDDYKINLDSKIFFNQEDIKKIKNNLIQIESHSYDHVVLSRCSKTILEEQIKKNKDLLSNLDLSNNLHFSIPFGKEEHYSDDIIKEIRNQGYQFIYKSIPGKFNESNINKKNYLFPRISSMKSSKELVYLINRSFFKN